MGAAYWSIQISASSFRDIEFGHSSIINDLDKPKNVLVATVEVELSQLEGKRTIAIVMNASTFEQEA